MNDNVDHIRYIHLRNNDYAELEPAIERPHSNGGATIAYSVLPNGDDKVIVEAAIAYCSPRDTFNRRVGRSVAAGRLRKGGVSANGNPNRTVHLLPKPDDKGGAGAGWRMLEARIIRAVVNY